MLEFRLSALSSENYNIIEGGVAWATTACLRGGVDKRFVALRGGQGWGVPTWQIVGVHIRTALLFLRDPLVGALWEVAADGSDLHLKVAGWDHPLDGCHGHWTPDGKYLIFDS